MNDPQQMLSSMGKLSCKQISVVYYKLSHFVLPDLRAATIVGALSNK